MVHAVRIKDGTATYSNRFVETSKLKQEKKAGGQVFASVSAMFRELSDKFTYVFVHNQLPMIMLCYLCCAQVRVSAICLS
jgi:hypothetical protein